MLTTCYLFKNMYDFIPFQVPVQSCDMLREGAPVPPEPPIGSWKPELHVSYT